MTLSLSLGITLGVKRTLWMMAGELLGVALVAVAAVAGVATLMLGYPAVFQVFKYVGGAYLMYLGVQMWRSRGRVSLSLDTGTAGTTVSRRQLAVQGFVTAVANPKGWAFFIALLPPFIDSTRAVPPQLAVLVGVILALEFCCLLLYASGGRSLGRFLQDAGHTRLLNRIAGTLMFAVGVWLAAA
jgi:threonine/homoserine/homoserine lactone efflux protein